jgi:hypothetical protein
MTKEKEQRQTRHLMAYSKNPRTGERHIPRSITPRPLDDPPKPLAEPFGYIIPKSIPRPKRQPKLTRLK